MNSLLPSWVEPSAKTRTLVSGCLGCILWNLRLSSNRFSHPLFASLKPFSSSRHFLRQASTFYTLAPSMWYFHTPRVIIPISAPCSIPAQQISRQPSLHASFPMLEIRRLDTCFLPIFKSPEELACQVEVELGVVSRYGGRHMPHVCRHWVPPQFI